MKEKESLKDLMKNLNLKGEVFAYLRVSSKEQSWERQLAQIKEWNILQKNIYCEKASGKDFERKEYKKLKRRLKAGDVLIITGLDRLGRNYEEIKEEWRYLTKQKKIEIYVLDMPLLNSGLYQDFLWSFVARLVLEILAFVAEQERRNIKQRQAEGIVAAKERGTVFGRPRKEINFEKWFLAYKNGECSLEEACRQMGIGKTTFYRRKKSWMESRDIKDIEACIDPMVRKEG